jgi:hypothetical protein
MFGVCYTIFMETIALLGQKPYAFCNVVTKCTKKHSVIWFRLRMEGGSFRNVMFVLNTGTIKNVLVNDGDVTQLKPLSKIHTLPLNKYTFWAQCGGF